MPDPYQDMIDDIDDCISMLTASHTGPSCGLVELHQSWRPDQELFPGAPAEADVDKVHLLLETYLQAKKQKALDNNRFDSLLPCMSFAMEPTPQSPTHVGHRSPSPPEPLKVGSGRKPPPPASKPPPPASKGLKPPPPMSKGLKPPPPQRPAAPPKL